MTRILVMAASAALTAQAIADLAREAEKVNLVLADAGRQIAATLAAVDLQRHVALQLNANVEPHPAPKFSGDRPYLKRKKGRS
jgi:hypothetical protein